MLETEKTLQNLKKIFFDVTNISADKMAWRVDSNSKAGRTNEEQERELLLKYLEYFQNHVFFLPERVPEDVIYNEDKFRILLGEDGFPDVSSASDSKKKLYKISETMGQGLQEIVSYLIYWFIKEKNDDYQYIFNKLKEIVEGRSI